MFNACIEDISVKNYKFCSFPLKIMEYEKKIMFLDTHVSTQHFCHYQ